MFLTKFHLPKALHSPATAPKIALMTHKYRGSIVAFLINKSVEPNEELKVEFIFPSSSIDHRYTLRMLNVRFTKNKYETRSTLWV